MINWWLNDQLIKESTELLSDKQVISYYLWITIITYYYQLPKLLNTIWETDTVTNILTDQQLYKVTNWLFKEARNWQTFQPINCPTDSLISPISEKKINWLTKEPIIKPTEWPKNWRNSSNLYRFKISYLVRKTNFTNWFQVFIFHWLS